MIISTDGAVHIWAIHYIGGPLANTTDEHHGRSVPPYLTIESHGSIWLYKTRRIPEMDWMEYAVIAVLQPQTVGHGVLDAVAEGDHRDPPC